MTESKTLKFLNTHSLINLTKDKIRTKAMPKNILMINSSQNNIQPLINLFAELKQKGHNFYLLSSTANLYNRFKQKNWPAKKIYFGPNLNNKFNIFIFICLLPILYLAHSAYLLYLARSKKISVAICLNWNEKIIITPIAKILGVKIIWLEPPNINYKAKNKFLLRLYKFNFKRAVVVGLTDLTKIKLKQMGLNEDNINIVNSGIKLNQFRRQDTIFNTLAQTDQKNFHRKYFTVGAVADLAYQQNIETLFQAIKICLTVIPNLQLIVVGDGAERKNLTWLAKKMGIDSLVWFVGEADSLKQSGQAHLKKWLDSFDVFVVASETPNLTDFDTCLRAMAIGLPIIGPSNFGLENIVQENKTGFLIENNNEILAQQIIKLQQNKHLRLRLGKEAKERVDKYFGIDNMVGEFEKLI